MLQQLESGYSTAAEVRDALLALSDLEGYDEQLERGHARLEALRARLSPLHALASRLPDDLCSPPRRSYTAHHVVSGEPPISRAEAVRRVLLDNFLRRQLDAGAVSADRVSLIKIQSEDAAGAAVPFALLPLDATLAERIDAALDDPRSHGPLVTHADAHLLPHAKTSVLFLSDGRPSDRVDERELPQLLGGQLRALHSATLGRLASFQLLGFGDAHERMLKSMAAMVPGNLATFNVVSGRAHAQLEVRVEGETFAARKMHLLLEVGDWLYFSDMGAYTSCVGSNFTGMELPDAKRGDDGF
ncbi:hypothetical protein EMIHUDRAFT_216041 [Emiliania huxleyi CCMP1516]|uniref:Orn/DAP/Arg decarboxylase 2 C-terminal domain-containing protein n=2 Tax=Emiliania huxleyi TaxID=2903 RepID=A0A0D3IFB3_EMIH1|nr:hypothetical protein EMIHUDRAFT_216041 [Emiliania huxleyi CCMP1516]EOD09948.1 hypothetical protein EMIHUDRAFT_216041 [Emiliania huxleyi CCMP1516]|eukprot:XP_005762377.1 hypothetical protein EMIHUDRAFT_216041 [Emiliania huxleyi CCMP1516]